jgi:hypothetical protein
MPTSPNQLRDIRKFTDLVHYLEAELNWPVEAGSFDDLTFEYPERFAQEALGHNSKAVHRTYAKRALMKIPSLEDYEERTAIKAQSAA